MSKKDSKQWFAMRATYSQEVKAQKELANLSITTFVPMTYKTAIRSGRKTKILAPTLNNYIFVHCTENEIFEAKKGISYLRYVMDHENKKIVVPEDQMDNFIRVSSVNDNSATYYLPNEIDFKGSPRIRIHGGLFDGVEGRYITIKGKRSRRLYVDIDNLIGLTVIVDPEVVEVLG
ncbi:MAG: UpxY family transcription antiterminator [Rikenellaceae bacterium]